MTTAPPPNPTKPRRRRALFALALAACASLPACVAPSVTVFAIAAPPAGATMAAGLVAAPIAFAQRHGPSVTIVNRADVPMDARIWVARVDVSKPAGYADLRTDDRLGVTVEPNQLLYLNAGRPFWVTGVNDALVWIRFSPSESEGADDPGVDPVWFSFERPGPYKVEVAGEHDPDAPDAGLEFYPLEDTVMNPLPRSGWIERHDGIHPITSTAN